MAWTGRISVSMLTHSKVSMFFNLVCTWVLTCDTLGNERDYIIVSLVRTRGLGFLDDHRRTNVMLTRCKQGMFLVMGRSFIEQKGAECLVGQLVKHLGDKAWITVQDLENGKIVLK